MQCTHVIRLLCVERKSIDQNVGNMLKHQGQHCCGKGGSGGKGRGGKGGTVVVVHKGCELHVSPVREV